MYHQRLQGTCETGLALQHRCLASFVCFSWPGRARCSNGPKLRWVKLASHGTGGAAYSTVPIGGDRYIACASTINIANSNSVGDTLPTSVRTTMLKLQAMRYGTWKVSRRHMAHISAPTTVLKSQAMRYGSARRNELISLDAIPAA